MKISAVAIWNEFKSKSEKLLLVSLLLVFIGFTASRALLSIGMASILIAGLTNLSNFNFKNIFERKEIWLLTFLFWSVAVSGIWSEDKTVWLNFTRIHLPFLLLPLGLIFINPPTTRQIKTILWLYVIVFSISIATVLGNYVLHFSSINKSIESGGVIPMPHNHIRYSLLLVMAFFSATWLSFLTKNTSRKFAISLSIFLFTSIHILSVRSALVSLYAGLIILLILNLRHLGCKKIISTAALVILFISALFNFVPSLKNKIGYMRYDLTEYFNNKSLDASDGMRIRSWKAGFEVAQNTPFYGSGYGDIYIEMQNWYTNNFPNLLNDQKKLPHNQFLWWWVTLGWLGLLLSVTALLFPLIKLWHKSDWLFKVFYTVLLVSFLWEPTLEEQMGTGFCAVWLFLIIYFAYRKNND
ncbi:MAG TPA: O-antigen ligase family protein [Chitinophagales bacterium]|nr:O-antigen ligase family protein [Chitinophagales bacterium]HRP39358.1 O-antigen ligase family protein [Chitinophagales bacterium]